MLAVVFISSGIRSTIHQRSKIIFNISTGTNYVGRLSRWSRLESNIHTHFTILLDNQGFTRKKNLEIFTVYWLLQRKSINAKRWTRSMLWTRLRFGIKITLMSKDFSDEIRFSWKKLQILLLLKLWRKHFKNYFSQYTREIQIGPFILNYTCNL